MIFLIRIKSSVICNFYFHEVICFFNSLNYFFCILVTVGFSLRRKQWMLDITRDDCARGMLRPCFRYVSTVLHLLSIDFDQTWGMFTVNTRIKHGYWPFFLVQKWQQAWPWKSKHKMSSSIRIVWKKYTILLPRSTVLVDIFFIELYFWYSLGSNRIFFKCYKLTVCTETGCSKPGS